MEQIYDEDVKNASERLEAIRADITRQDAEILSTRDRGARSYSEGRSLTAAAEQLQTTILQRDLLLKAEELAVAELNRLKKGRPVYAKALQGAKDELQTLEAEQTKNFVAFLQSLAAAWESAFSMAVICRKAKKMDSEYRNELAIRETAYGMNYLHDLEQLLAVIEARRPEAYKASGLALRTERYHRAGEVGLNLGGLI
jgi:hypothetical protein